MKKINFWSLALLAAGLTMTATSCTSDDVNSENEPNVKRASMSLFGNSGEDGSRTQLGENNNVFFCKGDSISVFNNADTNENAPFVANKDEDFPGTDPDTARAATFNGKANVGAQYFAILYPYQKDATATSVGGDTAAITATIPATQKAKEGNFDPHASVSVGLAQAHEWDVPKFYLRNVGGLLKFTAGGTGYNKIEITGAKNENIAGKVSISVSGADAPDYTVLTGVKKITLTDVDPGKIYYVGILPQTFDKGITMDFFNGASKVGTKTIFNSTAGPTVKRSKVCNVGTVTPEKPEPKPIGVFTVAVSGTDTTKVSFAWGNLYYDGTNWGFEDEQYYFRTNEGGCKCDAGGYNKTYGTSAGHWGIFSWVGESSTTFTAAPQIYGVGCTSKTYTDYGNIAREPVKSDWGNISGLPATPKGWHTLDGGDYSNNIGWYYLLNSRKDNGTGTPAVNTTARFAKATVHSVPGLLLIPDGYAVSSNKTNINEVEIVNVNKDVTDSFPYIKDEDWPNLESAGVVFLPCASYYDGDDMYPSSATSNNPYWARIASSSFSTAKNAPCLNISKNLSITDMSYRYYRGSVRLVTDLP